VDTPVFITKNGYSDLVIMSVDAYEDLLESAAIDVAITEAESEFAVDGRLHDAREALASLKRKRLG